MTNRTSYVIAPNGRIIYAHSDLDWREHVTNTLAAVPPLAGEPAPSPPLREPKRRSGIEARIGARRAGRSACAFARRAKGTNREDFPMKVSHLALVAAAVHRAVRLRLAHREPECRGEYPRRGRESRRRASEPGVQHRSAPPRTAPTRCRTRRPTSRRRGREPRRPDRIRAVGRRGRHRRHQRHVSRASQSEWKRASRWGALFVQAAAKNIRCTSRPVSGVLPKPGAAIVEQPGAEQDQPVEAHRRGEALLPAGGL